MEMDLTKYIRALRFPIATLRRLSGRDYRVYERSVFSDRDVGVVGITSVHAERSEGGWRGFGGIVVERKWSDIFSIDVFLTEERPRLIIELGTGSGGFSSYLVTYAHLNGVRFHTFDTHRKSGMSKQRNSRAVRFVKRNGGAVHRQDVFDPATVSLIGALLRTSGKAFVYCDNGDKARELRTYAGLLKVGDFIGIHDFSSEVFESDVAPMMEGGVYRPWRGDFFKGMASSNRVFEKVLDRAVRWPGV